MTSQEAIRRVLRLLALAQSPNPKEAASARARALQLTRLHNLTPLDISRARRVERVRAGRSAVSMSALTSGWEVRTCLSIGAAFGCNVTVTRGFARYDGVGAVAARDVVERVIGCILRWLGDDPAFLLGPIRPRAPHGTPDEALLDGFLFGVVDTIGTRLFARRGRKVEAPPQPTGDAPFLPTNSVPDEETEAGRRWEAQTRQRLADAERVAVQLFADPFVCGFAVSALRPLEGTARAAEADLDTLRGVDAIPFTSHLLTGPP